MILKESWVWVSDATNIRWIKTFHLYKGFFRKKTKQSFFIKGSARIVEPPRIEYKGFKYKYNLKGDISRLLIVKTNSKLLIRDGSTVRFNSNTGILIKKKSEPRSKYVYGPIYAVFKRKRFLSLFKYSY